MAEWNKSKVLPSAINGGQEFTTKDNLAINELNAIVNNSFYASEISETSIAKADSAVATSKLAEDKIDNFIKTEGNSVVTLNGVPQVTWSADFAEAERQKSKNLLPYPYQNTTKTVAGITYTVNSEGSITVSGTATYNAVFSLNTIPLNKGTYITKIVNKNSQIKTSSNKFRLQLHYDNLWLDVENTTFTLSDNKNCNFELYVPQGATVNETIIIEVSTDGAIVHEKQIADVEHKKIIYDSNLQPTPLGNNTDYSNGINISSEGTWYPMNLTDLKRIMISATYNKEQQINAFIDLENLGGNTTYSSRGCFGKDGVYLGEVGVAVHNDKQKIYVFSTVDTIIYRIIGWY